MSDSFGPVDIPIGKLWLNTDTGQYQAWDGAQWGTVDTVECPECEGTGRRLTRCQARFKDAACGYAGPETVCDKRFETCTDLGNEMRFVGLLGLPVDECPRCEGQGRLVVSPPGEVRRDG